jgi:O-Antigen ligase
VKWIFLLGLLILTPALAAYLKGNRRQLPKAAFLLGLLPFIEAKYNISASPITWPAWQGIAKGITLSLTDAVAIAMIAASYRAKTPRIIAYAFGLFIAAFLLSTALAPVKTPSLFYGWELLRAVLIFFAVMRATMTVEQVPLALFTGLVAGLATQGVAVAIEFAGGARQAGGWFGHQNLLGMATHFVVFPAFALFLGGHYQIRAGIAVASAVVIAFAGGSRATIGLIGLGLFATLVLSIWHKSTGRKIAIAAAATIGMLAASPILLSAIDRRSDVERESSSDIRVKMMNAASQILADYPFGVGPNRYVVVVNTEGYSSRNKVEWTSAAAPVHNTYYLVAAEMGWLGLAGLIGLFGSVIWLAISTLKRTRPGFRAEYVAGVAVAFIAVAIHAYVEWITITYGIQALFAMSLAMVATANQVPARKPVRRRPRPLVAGSHVPAA